jgi:hypothetical protein
MWGCLDLADGSERCAYWATPPDAFAVFVSIGGEVYGGTDAKVSITNDALLVSNNGGLLGPADSWAVEFEGQGFWLSVDFWDETGSRLSDAEFLVNASLVGWTRATLWLQLEGPSVTASAWAAGDIETVIPEPTSLALLLPTLVGVLVGVQLRRVTVSRLTAAQGCRETGAHAAQEAMRGRRTAQRRSMSDWDGIERRKWPRVRTNAVVAIHNGEVGTQLADSVDLSQGGIRCTLEGNEFKVGHIVEITFQLGDRNAGSVGQVVRVNQLAPLAQEIAVEFLELGDETLASFEDLGLPPDASEPEE